MKDSEEGASYEVNLAINWAGQGLDGKRWFYWGPLGSDSEDGSNGFGPAPPPICLLSCSTSSGLVACICWANCCPLCDKKENQTTRTKLTSFVVSYTWSSDSRPPPPPLWPVPDIIWFILKKNTNYLLKYMKCVRWEKRKTYSCCIFGLLSICCAIFIKPIEINVKTLWIKSPIVYSDKPAYQDC